MFKKSENRGAFGGKKSNLDSRKKEGDIQNFFILKKKKKGKREKKEGPIKF